MHCCIPRRIFRTKGAVAARDLRPAHLPNPRPGLFLVGPILQELLDGLRARKDFDRLRYLLDPFPLLPLERETYVAAAKLRQRCRANGVQAGAIDCLIAAACIDQGYPLLTADRDFLHIAQHSKLVVIRPGEAR